MIIGGGSGKSGRPRVGQVAKAESDSQSVWSGKTVLVVDDLAPVRDQLCELYQSLGMKVAGTASNGVEALAFLETTAVDLVSLDIIMPEMDGIECYRKIRLKGYTCRCFFVSWLAADPRVPERLKAEIPSDFFQGKPVDEEILRARLTKVFSYEPGFMPGAQPEEERAVV